MAALDIFILVVYIILLQPILYCLWKHGKSGMLGWLPLQSFALVRIIGSILAIHNAAVHSTSEDALIFSNVGLSPLLLATAGILHEAYLLISFKPSLQKLTRLQAEGSQSQS
jgi:hypothetical protein